MVREADLVVVGGGAKRGGFPGFEGFLDEGLVSVCIYDFTDEIITLFSLPLLELLDLRLVSKKIYNCEISVETIFIFDS